VKLKFFSRLVLPAEMRNESFPTTTSYSCDTVPVVTQKSPPPITIDGNNHNSNNNINIWAPTILPVSTFQESLKYDNREDRLYASKSMSSRNLSKNTDSMEENQPPPPKQQQQRRRTTSRTTTTTLPKSLSFHETVQVVPIPMHTEYSNHVKARLWSNAMEIQENAARNTLEFASEGYVPVSRQLCNNSWLPPTPALCFTCMDHHSGDYINCTKTHSFMFFLILHFLCFADGTGGMFWRKRPCTCVLPRASWSIRRTIIIECCQNIIIMDSVYSYHQVPVTSYLSLYLPR
jgi:hypothetical protein